MSGQRERELIGIIEKQIARMDALFTSVAEAFDLDYDWDRLDFLRKKLNAAHPVAVMDLRVFMDFLRALS